MQEICLLNVCGKFWISSISLYRTRKSWTFGLTNSWNYVLCIHKLKWIYFRRVLAIWNHCGPPPELQLFFFKRIMTLHQGNSCSLFQNGHQVIKKARWPCHQMTSCKLMCYCCYLRDLFGWIIFQGNKRHMVIADWAMVD